MDVDSILHIDLAACGNVCVFGSSRFSFSSFTDVICHSVYRLQTFGIYFYHSDLAYLYGTIVTDGKDEYSQEITANCCVFAEREVTFEWYLSS
jgi:hypothetical protein